MAVLQEALGPSILEWLHLYSVLPVLLVVVWIVYQRVFSPLAGVPGPFWASLSRAWITTQVRREDMHRQSIELHRKYGKFVRVGPNEILTTDLEAIKKIYAAGSKFRKSEWYSVWQGRRKFDLFAERDEGIHAAHRRLVSRPYALDWLKGMEPCFDDVIRIFMKRMEEMKGQVMDMGYWVHLFAFDIIGEITFSKSFGYLDAGTDGGAFQQIEAALRGSWIGQVPSLYWVHDYLTPLIGNHLAIANRHGSIRTFTVKAVTARMDRGTDRRDMLGALLKVHDEKPDQFDDAAVVSMAASNVFAGSDTTAVSLRAVIYYLLKNPDSKAKLLQEIDGLRKQAKLSDPVSVDEGNAMPYLQAVMYEALRLHPGVGLSLPRVVPRGGLEAGGYFFPEGTIIGTNPWAIHREKSVYGDDVDIFRPERWLQGNSGDMHRFFFAFGAGARLCIGKNISWMEMTKLIPTIFMHYDLELADPDKPWTEFGLWFVLQKGLNVRMRRRSLAD